MSNNSIIYLATAGHQKIPPNWMSATQVRPLIFEDPAVIWLNYHGEKHGFQPDTSPFDFLDFIGEKSRQFEDKWIKEITPDAVRVCSNANDVFSVEKFHQTLDLMQKGIPAIVHASLWWAPERIYGVPDLLVHTSFIKDKFPELISKFDHEAIAENLGGTGELGHYVIFDIKFTSKLDETNKTKDLRNYSAQVRIYSYVLGHLQGLMPKKAYLITRDRIDNPLAVDITSILNQPLEDELLSLRDTFLEIKLNGAKYTPWNDDLVVSDVKNKDDRWRTAKEIIAREKIPGMDSALLYYISPSLKRELLSFGFPNLNSMLQENPQKIPFEKFKGLGAVRSKQIRTILEANQSESPVLPPSSFIPLCKSFEFYIDFEYFSNVNVDFETQWPTLEGCEMNFMIGVGWVEKERWYFQTFTAEKEDQDKERKMFEKFFEFLQAKTDSAVTDRNKLVLYHWTNAEVTQARRAADRHQFDVDNPLRNLPWYDLQKVFLNGPCGIPHAWNYGLKEIAKSIGKLNPEYDPQWPGDLDEGLRAMVMGWKAYQNTNPLKTQEMSTLTQYLEADCKALWKLLKWLRSNTN